MELLQEYHIANNNKAFLFHLKSLFNKQETIFNNIQNFTIKITEDCKGIRFIKIRNKDYWCKLADYESLIQKFSNIDCNKIKSINMYYIIGLTIPFNNNKRSTTDLRKNHYEIHITIKYKK